MLEAEGLRAGNSAMALTEGGLPCFILKQLWTPRNADGRSGRSSHKLIWRLWDSFQYQQPREEILSMLLDDLEGQERTLMGTIVG